MVARTLILLLNLQLKKVFYILKISTNNFKKKLYPVNISAKMRLFCLYLKHKNKIFFEWHLPLWIIVWDSFHHSFCSLTDFNNLTNNASGHRHLAYCICLARYPFPLVGMDVLKLQIIIITFLFQTDTVIPKMFCPFTPHLCF